MITSDVPCDDKLYVSCCVFSLLTASNAFGVKSHCLKEITICTFYCNILEKQIYTVHISVT